MMRMHTAYYYSCMHKKYSNNTYAYICIYAH